MSLGTGAQLGAAAGIAGWLFFVLMNCVVLLTPARDLMRQVLFDLLDKAAVRNPTPEMNDFVQHLKSPDGFALLLALVFAGTFVSFTLLSSLGGMLGSALFSKRSH